jgi:Lar family restriction alleviation protein
MTDEQLKPCPFCGTSASMSTMPEGSGSDGSMYVECDNSLCRASSALIYPLKDSVEHLLIERWNRRAP